MTTILYHGNCPDGFTSAWVARKKFGDKAEYIPCFYGQPFPESARGCDCYVLDFSFPARVILDRQLDESYLLNVTEFKVLDHHKTAEADLKEYPGCCIFDMNRSGAAMTWDYFFPGKSRPLFVDYIQDHDLWRFELPDSEAVRLYRQAHPMTWEARDALETEIEYEMPRIKVAAIAMAKYRDRMVEEMASHAVEKEVGGVKMPVVNCSVLFSEVADFLAGKHPIKAAAYYFDREDGKRQWGMRSRGGPDVSEIAKKYGGGGHRNAAGFIDGMSINHGTRETHE